MLLEIFAVLLLALGLIVTTIGLYGVHRLPGIYNKLHAAGMVAGPGVIAVLIASIGTRDAGIITRAVVAIAFLLLTAPISSHAIACAAHRRRTPRPEAAEACDDGGSGVRRGLRHRDQGDVGGTTDAPRR
jgi:monovalent cation/proton antiporter MnhG/PhaG subunit